MRTPNMGPPMRPSLTQRALPEQSSVQRPGDVNTSYDAPRSARRVGLMGSVQGPPDPYLPFQSALNQARTTAESLRGIGRYDARGQEEEAADGPFASGGRSAPQQRGALPAPSPARAEAAPPPSGYGTSRQAITSDEDTAAAGGENAGGTPGAPPARGGGREAGPVYNAAGQRVDPVTGQPIDEETRAPAPGNTDYGHGRYASADQSAANAPAGASWAMDDPMFEQEQAQRRAGYGEETQGFLGELAAQGYYVDANGKIRDSAGNHYGYAGDIGTAREGMLPSNILGLLDGYREKHATEMEAEQRAQRDQELQDRLGMIPDAPKVDRDMLDEAMRSRRAAAALQSGQGLQAGLAMAGRGRMGAGFQSGLVANQANQFAAQQAALDAQDQWQAMMTDLQAELDHWEAQIALITRAIDEETDADRRAELFAQQVAFQRERDAVAREIAAEEERAAREQGLLQVGGRLAGAALGTLVAPGAGTAAGAAAGGALTGG